jgi:Tfp pilus assembly protein PilV
VNFNVARFASRRQRGGTLIEALVALTVLSSGLLGTAQFHAGLRQSAEGTRLRAEAVRLARQDLESMRGFADADGYTAIATATREVSGPAASFRITRSINGDDSSALKRSRVEVEWIDRRGKPQSLVLASAIAGTLPAYSGLLALAPKNAAAPFAASPALPWGAVPTIDGRAASLPSRQAGLVLVFDAGSGGLRSVCRPAVTTTAAAAATNEADACTAVDGPVAFGHVRFASAEPVDPTTANGTPLPLDVEVVPTAGAACLSEAREVVQPGQGGQPDRFTAFTCWRNSVAAAIAADELRIVPRGWTIGVAAGEQRVCRYVDDDTAGSSANQHNFLVMPAPAACPSGTRAHQP